MTRTEEKLKLAEELGIEGYVQTQKQALKDAIAKEERDAVIQELTSMKWKPLTKDSFKFFPSFVFDWKSFQLGPFETGGNRGFFMLLSYIAFPLAPIGLLLALVGCLRRVNIASMPLSEWKDDLPYGALLAVKEAKENGVTKLTHWGNDFRIYYPRLEARRVNADPIITGLYKGIEVEIFAWDDRKIRPEDY